MRKNLSTLLDLIINDTNTYNLSQEAKQRGLSQLYNLMLCAEDAISIHTDKIVRFIYKYINDEDKKVALIAHQIATLFGVYVPPNDLINVLLKHIADVEIKSMPSFSIAHLTLFTEAMKKFHSTEFIAAAPGVLEFLKSFDISDS